MSQCVIEIYIECSGGDGSIGKTSSSAFARKSHLQDKEMIHLDKRFVTRFPLFESSTILIKLILCSID